MTCQAATGAGGLIVDAIKESANAIWCHLTSPATRLPLHMWAVERTACKSSDHEQLAGRSSDWEASSSSVSVVTMASWQLRMLCVLEKKGSLMHTMAARHHPAAQHMQEFMQGTPPQEN